MGSIMNKLKVLDLFSGIGGFSLGLERTGGFVTVAFCEIEDFPRKILSKHWPNVPCFDDVRTLEYDGSVDVICGGYPCQPFSVAGNRKGKEDDRHLWPAMFSLIKKHRPAWVIGENVAGHVSMGLDDVLADLEGEGYECRPFIIPACAVGANHRRDRLWIIGHSKHNGQLASTQSGGFKAPIRNNAERQKKASKFKRTNVLPSYNFSERIQGNLEKSLQGESAFSWVKKSRRVEDYFNRSDLPKPLICREYDGFSGRVDRIIALGNSVVPQIPEIIGNAILCAQKEVCDA